MATRSVRFDEETEKVMTRLTRVTGLSISEILKRGVFAYQQLALEQAEQQPWTVYAALDLGEGGWAQADSTEAKAAVAEIIRQKHSS